jgi:hypothetical protein
MRYTLQLFSPFSFCSYPLPAEQRRHQLLIWCAESRFRAALIAINRDPPARQRWKQKWLKLECVSKSCRRRSEMLIVLAALYYPHHWYGHGMWSGVRVADFSSITARIFLLGRH